MNLSHSTHPHKTVEYYKLPTGLVDVFLHQNERIETNDDNETIYIAEEAYFQTDGSVSKDEIESDFKKYWNLAETKKLSEKEKVELLSKSVISLEGRQNTTEPLVERVKTATEIYEENKNDETMPLEALKFLKIESLKEKTNYAIENGFYVEDNFFGFNTLHDQANFTQQLLLIVSGESSPIQWKTKNNGVITLTVIEFQGVVRAAELHKRTQQSKYWELEKQVKDASTKEDIQSIQWL